MIKDSGCRREYSTGAVRDIQEGKGRCDLLPLSEVSYMMNDEILGRIELFRTAGDETDLYEAVKKFSIKAFGTVPNAMLELSKHFEEGAKKYGEYNWQKGIPEQSYIDSAVRHYLKWLDGVKDEPHDRAFIWNLMCLAWTHNNILEKRCVDTSGTINVACNTCAYYISEPESQLYQKCLKDKDDMTRPPSYWCEDWKERTGK